ncbi:MAG TPA: MDR family MFS transporter [Stellaceae bacterium]|jgi:MFS family permease|nr:MDR family MFS transporter [Stellaceae bacterium]
MAVQVSDKARPWVVGSVMLGMFIVASETTIVATAMPSIVSQLGGFSHYSWLFAAFLLPQTTTTVIWGKLSDQFGRRPTITAGYIIFLTATLLCGFAWSMPSLIAFRLLQGIGAGAIQPINMTIVADLYTLEQRAKVQGYISGTWAVAGILGPLLGGAIVKFLPWAWVFWLNLPIGLVALAGMRIFAAEHAQSRAMRIDYTGAGLFAVTVLALLCVISEPDMGNIGMAVCAAVTVVGAAVTLWWERRVPEPIISIKLWTRRLIATCNMSAVLFGMILLGVTTMLPIYVQGVLGGSPVVAGAALIMLAGGTPTAIIIARPIFNRIGLAETMRLGAFCLCLGMGGMLTLSADSSIWLCCFYMLIMGFGMGWGLFIGVVMTQEAVELPLRGSAVAANVFCRSLGSAIGASALGAILNYGLAHDARPADEARLRDMLNHAAGLASVAGSAGLRDVLYNAVHMTFWGVEVFAVASLIVAFLVPNNEVVAKGSHRGRSQPTAAGD